MIDFIKKTSSQITSSIKFLTSPSSWVKGYQEGKEKFPFLKTLVMDDIDVQKSEAWKPATAAFIDESYLIGYLTVEEYYQFIGRLRGKTEEEVTVFVKGFEPFFNLYVNQEPIRVVKSRTSLGFKYSFSRKTKVRVLYIYEPDVIPILQEQNIYSNNFSFHFQFYKYYYK